MVATATQDVANMGVMPEKESNRLFTSKLKRAVGNTTKSVIDRAAGFTEGTVSLYMSRGTLPQPYATLKLARALEVDLAWLMDEDDTRLDPPDKIAITPSVTDVPDDKLVQELATRYLQRAPQLYEAIQRAHKTHWAHIAISLWADLKPGMQLDDLSDEAKEVLNLAAAIDALTFAVNYYGKISDEAVQIHRRREPEGPIPSGELDLDRLNERADSLCKECFGFSEVLSFHGSMTRRTNSKMLKLDRALCLVKLLSAPEFVNDKRYDPLRKSLEKSGYLDAEGKPTRR